MDQNKIMQRAIDLAKQGWPKVAPNPMVGCVIVHDGEIVAEGFHQEYGAPHAEVNAIKALSPDILPKECELYVTLEPCSHYGKTPPCADLISSKGFKKVVVACLDPNPLVAGMGIQKLKLAGIEVEVGVLEAEARDLNKRFITFFEKKRPYIFLKWAQTADGFISRMPLPMNRADNLISGKEAQQFVHQLRSEVTGILVGKNTVLSDNPHLTNRLVDGKHPIRIFLDKDLEVPQSYHIYNSESKTIILNRVKEAQEGHLSFVKLDFEDSKQFVSVLLTKLGDLQIQSLLVEGGTVLLKSFIDANSWDEAFVLVNPNLSFGTGIVAPTIQMPSEFEEVGEDRLFRLKNG